MVASTAWQLTRRKRDYLEFSIPIDRNIVYQRISTSVIVRAAFKVVGSRDDEASMSEMAMHRKMINWKRRPVHVFLFAHSLRNANISRAEGNFCEKPRKRQQHFYPLYFYKEKKMIWKFAPVKHTSSGMEEKFLILVAENVSELITSSIEKLWCCRSTEIDFAQRRRCIVVIVCDGFGWW